MDPSNETTSPAKPSVAKESNMMNGLVPLFVEQPPMVVPITTLVRKPKPPSKVMNFLVNFLVGAAAIAFIILLGSLPVFGVYQTMGFSAGLICLAGCMMGMGVVLGALFIVDKISGGITVGGVKRDKKKKEEAETDPEVPPAPAPVPQLVAVTPADPVLHNKEEPRYLRKLEQEDVAKYKKQLVGFGLILFVAYMGLFVGFIYWLSYDFQTDFTGWLIGYLVGVGYFPLFLLVCRLADTKEGKVSGFIWVYEDPVVAARASIHAGKQKQVEMALQPLMKPENNQVSE